MNFRNFNIKRLKSKRSLVVVILIVVVAFAVKSMYSLTRNKGVEVKQEIRNVKTQKINLGSISAEVEYAGNLKPAKEVVVLSKTGGKIASVNVNVGDKVTVGQVLYTLDKSELDANLQSQQAALDGANADLEKTSDSSQAQQVSQAEQAAGKAQVQFSSAEDNYNRMQKLYQAGAISKKELDDSKTQYDNASIDLKTAQDNLNILENKIGPQATRSAAARVNQAQAAVNTAQIQVNNTTITSPITGVISSKDVEVGQMASGQSGSVTVIDSSTLTAEITVPDKMVEKLQVGQTVTIAITALDNKTVSGVIDVISPNANSKDNSYTVKVKIDNTNGELKAGMFAKVSLQAESKENVLTVPNQAIRIENGVNYIYVVENSKVRKVSVDTGISNDKSTEIAGNVKAGADIITEGQNLLDDGEKVNIVK